MPRPRPNAAVKEQAFQVMPWQNKSKKKKTRDSAAPAADAAPERDTPQGDAHAQGDDPLAAALREVPAELLPALQELSEDHKAPLQEEQEHASGSSSEEDEDDAPSQPGPAQDPLKACDFSDDEFVPAPVAAAPKRVGRGYPSQTTAPQHSTRAAQQEAAKARADVPAQPESQAAQGPDAARADIDGQCMLAVLPGRVALSGHCTAGSTAAARQHVGVMATLVGSASSSGHTCGIDDDEELFRATILHYDRLKPAEEVTYVCSTGGDLPRWRPAEAAQLQRLLPQSQPATQTRAGSDTNLPPAQDTAVSAAIDAAQQVCVWLEPTRLLDGQQAEDQLARFNRKLQGRDASVLLGTMRIQWQPAQS